MGNDQFSKEGFNSYGENSPVEKGGFQGDLTATSAVTMFGIFKLTSETTLGRRTFLQ